MLHKDIKVMECFLQQSEYLILTDKGRSKEQSKSQTGTVYICILMKKPCIICIVNFARVYRFEMLFDILAVYYRFSSKALVHVMQCAAYSNEINFTSNFKLYQKFFCIA